MLLIEKGHNKNKVPSDQWCKIPPGLRRPPAVPYSDDLCPGLATHNACQADHLLRMNRLSPMPNWFHCLYFFFLQPNPKLNQAPSVKRGSASFSIIFHFVFVLDPFHFKPCQLAQSSLKSLSAIFTVIYYNAMQYHHHNSVFFFLF